MARIEKRTCLFCGVKFDFTVYPSTRSDYGRYCSKFCRGRKVRPRDCARCGASFIPGSKEDVAGKGRWCSRACYDADRPATKSYRKIGGRHEHRIVAEQKIGRPLLPGEIVHHIDGDIHNNDPANLEILPSQAEHAREHSDVLEYARSRRRSVIGKRERDAARAAEALFPTGPVR